MHTIDTFMRILARWLALLGGLVLMALIALTVLSIGGRLLDSIGHSAFVVDNLSFLAPALQWFAPIKGDFELVEAGVAFAIMAFLPWCQLNRGHAKVDLIASILPATGNRLLAFVWELLFAAIITLLAWRLYEGMSAKMRYGETSFMLQFPVWWGYGLCFAASCIATFVAWWSVILHALEIGTSEADLPARPEQSGSEQKG